MGHLINAEPITAGISNDKRCHYCQIESAMLDTTVTSCVPIAIGRLLLANISLSHAECRCV